MHHQIKQKKCKTSKHEKKEQQLKQQQEETTRPKRRATNAHIFRYLQTRNPSRLEENDLKRALEASLEEDTASCSSSEQSNATTFSSGRSSSNSNNSTTTTNGRCRRGLSSRSLLITNHNNYANSQTATHNCCPMSSVHNRYKPVAKKNIYNEADFFHDGIMQYIEYELSLRMSQKKSNS